MTNPTNTVDLAMTFADKRGDIYLDALLKIREAVSDPELDRQELLVAVRSAIAEAQDAVHSAARGSVTPESGEKP